MLSIIKAERTATERARRPLAGRTGPLTAAIAAAMFSGASQGYAAQVAPKLSGDWTVCREAAAEMERLAGTPKQLISAVTLTETGRRAPGGKTMAPWPWTINAGGQGFVFATREEALRAARRLLARGHRSIDVGCMQVNLKYHPRAFTSLEEAFDPVANVAYATQFLSHLKARHGSWDAAVQHYHSYTEEYRQRYSARFHRLWSREQRRAARAGTRVRVADDASIGRMLKSGADAVMAGLRTLLPQARPAAQSRRVAAAMPVLPLRISLIVTPRAQEGGERGRMMLRQLAAGHLSTRPPRSSAIQQASIR